MTYTYEKVTIEFVEQHPMGTIFTTKQLMNFILKRIRKKIGHMKAASLLDGCNDCVSIDGTDIRKWKRVN